MEKISNSFLFIYFILFIYLFIYLFNIYAGRIYNISIECKFTYKRIYAHIHTSVKSTLKVSIPSLGFWEKKLANFVQQRTFIRGTLIYGQLNFFA